MNLIGDNGRVIRAGKKIKEGGEGAVYYCEQNPELVVKLYHKPPQPAKTEKLRELVAFASNDLVKISAWPVMLVYTSHRQHAPAGLIMPFLKGKEIHTLYSPHDRKSHFPSANWDFLVHVARNVAAAFDTLHNHRIVMGDVNEGNFLVAPNGMIGLIDCDSYQITGRSGKPFLCEVGIPLWTPPELQGRSFKGLTRSPNHDSFGLAVLIFYLLFMGRHPYAGIPRRNQEVTIEQAISNRLFPYSVRRPIADFLPPHNGLAMHSVPENLAHLFERAFLSGANDSNRPTAKEWCEGLTTLLKTLRSCPVDPSHRFYSRLTDCPWCAIRANGGPNFFISVGADSLFILNLNRCKLLYDQIDQMQMIAVHLPASLTFSGLQPQVFPPQIIVVPPEPVRPKMSRENAVLFVYALLALGCALLFLLKEATWLCYGASTIGLALLIFVSYRNGSYREERRRYSKEAAHYAQVKEEREKQVAAAQGQIQSFETQVFELDGVLKQLRSRLENYSGNYSQEWVKTKSAAKRAYTEAMDLPKLYSTSLSEMDKKKREAQLNAYLDTKLVAHARIHLVGEQKKRVLAQYGIESAFDISPDMQVPGFGPVLMGKLLAWKEQCKTGFLFKPDQKPDPQEVRNFSMRFKNLQESKEADLYRALHELRSQTDRYAARGAEIQKEWRESLERKAQILLNVKTIKQALHLN